MTIEFTAEQKCEIEDMIRLLNSPDKESQKLGKVMVQTCDFLQRDAFKYLIPLRVDPQYISYHSSSRKKVDKSNYKNYIPMEDFNPLGYTEKTIAARIKNPSLQKDHSQDSENITSLLLHTLISDDLTYEYTNSFFTIGNSNELAKGIIVIANTGYMTIQQIEHNKQLIKRFQEQIDNYRAAINSDLKAISSDISQINTLNEAIEELTKEYQKIEDKLS